MERKSGEDTETDTCGRETDHEVHDLQKEKRDTEIVSEGENGDESVEEKK